jgi:hypothetical protein
MSALRGKAENIFSQRVFRLLTRNGHRSWRVENDSFSPKEAADIAGKSESTLRGWSEVRGRLVGFVAFDQKPAYPGDDQHPDHNAERSGYKQSPNNPDYDCEEDSSLSHGGYRTALGCAC